MSRSNSDELPEESVWASLGHRERCRIVGSVRREIAGACDELVSLCESPQRVNPVETVSSELMPLCAALKFIARRGPSILKSEHLGWKDRPAWLFGVQSRVDRVPRGDVLVLAAWNYPLFLPGVQIAQALAAGNCVFVKPAPGCEAVTVRMAEAFYESGVPAEALCVLDSKTQSAIDQINEGVDLVVLTGSSETGRAVMRQCAETLTPTILELSGCDAVIVGQNADLSLAAKSIRFGLMFNSGATCIGPRRLIVPQTRKAEFIEALRREFQHVENVHLHPAAAASAAEIVRETTQRGATNILDSPRNSSHDLFPPQIFDGVAPDWDIANADIFAPLASLLAYAADDEAVRIVNQCRYRLAASVFGDVAWANSIAARLQVGTVTINDLIFPTADPRLPFGGRGESGFAVTRGPHGLLEMTLPRVIATHHGTGRLHLMPQTPGDFATLAGSLTLLHGRIRDKTSALRRMLSGIKLSQPKSNSLSPADPTTETDK